ncbi:MAG: hypothetical protein OEM05_00055 [Myxococcales bacterium]|nr:hypothetical protein [Myxococcales bacterium]
MESTRGPRESEPQAETAGEALERARGHARAAAAEALASLHALLDAAALAASGRPSEFHEVLSPIAKLLDGLAEQLGHEGAPVAASLLEAITDALDAEIGRWEERARDDPEARAVLRAFLGLREILWEFGVRRPDGASGPQDDGGPSTPKPGTPRSARRGRRPSVQRVPIEG